MNSKLLVENCLLNEDNSNLISNLTTAFMDKSDIEIKKKLIQNHLISKKKLWILLVNQIFLNHLKWNIMQILEH